METALNPGHGNRRADNRVAVDWQCRVGRKGMGIYDARIRNISIGGLYLECSQQFSPASHLLMEIRAEHGGKVRKLLSEGSVVRVDAATAGGVYGYGIRVLRYRDQDLPHLLAIVAELWARAREGAASFPQTRRDNRAPRLLPSLGRA